MWPPRLSVAVLLVAVACALLRRTPDSGIVQIGGGEQPAAGPDGGCQVGGAQQACRSSKLRAPNSTTAAGCGTADGATVPDSWHSSPAAGGLYIVRFKQYQMASHHSEALQDALAGTSLGAWQWVERHNPAAAFPTDFGLLRLTEPVDAVKARLEQLPFVKDVHPERQITRALLAAIDPSTQQQREGAMPASPSHEQQFAACSNNGDDDSDSPEQQHCVSKRPGRMQTRPTFSLEDNLERQDGSSAGGSWGAGGPTGGERVGNDTYTSAAAGSAVSSRRRRQLLQAGQTLASILEANQIWKEGFRGQGVKMGVFDTGIRGDHPDVKNIVERSNWTHEPTLDDGLGHGSFVAGVIAGTDPSCPGLAPEVLLHTFRVFTNDQVSYTSWFLDAFNYAIASKMNIVNLSIGGPDFLDLPFVEKVAEITSNGIIMVSAIGNDGPLYGTLNNPADQNDVIGIGGIDYADQIAPFSSRGMSTWEVPLGYGRSKPDVMAYGRDVQGSRITGGCRSLSGTSVASPVVAGAMCLLASVVPEEKRWQILNPASMKQALVEGAVRLPGFNLYEQGQGKLSVVNAKKILESYVPRASVVPSTLNLTDCPYMWPFCRQPVYAAAMPLMFNATILNGMGVVGRLEAPPVWAPADEGGRLLDIQFEYSGQLWPWSGYLALYIRVKDEGAAFSGTGSGEVSFTVVSPPALGETQERRSTVKLRVTAGIIPTPPREKRVLWDQFHSIRYPPAYFPRDDLQVRHDILDWHGDHPHTNFHDMYDALRNDGFYLEVLASPATCFDAARYGALLIVDSEDEFYLEEVAKLAADVEQLGLGLIVFADWYHLDTIKKLRFYDDNTRSWWEAATGGANVPALNDMLTPYGAAFESGALEADITIEGVQAQFHMASGVTIKAMPAGGWLHRSTPKQKAGQPTKHGSAVLGLLQHGKGRLGLYGDSNCLDSSHTKSQCFKLLSKMVEWVAGGVVPELTAPGALLTNHQGNFDGMPERRSDFNFSEISPVLLNPLRCYPNAPTEFQGATFEQWKVPVARPVRQPVVVPSPPPPPAEQPREQQGGTDPAAGAAAAGDGGGLVGEGQQAAAGGGTAATGGQQKQKREPHQPEAVREGVAGQQAQQQTEDPAAAAEQASTGQHPQEEQQRQAAEQQQQAADAEASQKQQQEAEQQEQGEARQQQQQGEQQQQRGSSAAVQGDGEHPDISTLAEFGTEQPRHVEDDSTSNAGGSSGTGGGGSGSGGGKVRGEGGAARAGSLLHQQPAAADAAAEAEAEEHSHTAASHLHSSLLQFLGLVGMAAAVLWSRSRPRRQVQAQVPPFRIAPQPRRGWLLPMWGSAQRSRNR